METKNNRLSELFDLWIRAEASPAQKSELAELIRNENNLSQVEQSLQELFENTDDSKEFTIGRRELIAKNILLDFPAEKHLLFTQPRDKSLTPVVHRIHFLPPSLRLRRVIKSAWFRWAAAIIILFGIGTYILTHSSKPAKELAQTTPSSKSDDVLPGYSRAVLTLSDGQRVELDNAASETITDGNLSIKNNAGQLVYISERGSLSPAGGRTREAGEGRPATYNTMTTPRGGQYKLTLADGTKVWLNAASSITFPTSFKGFIREVSITGEAYFEVAKDKEKPFLVQTGQQQIEVLGTSFNVNAYVNEPISRISLLEGSVKVANTILKPGQAYTNGKVSSTDLRRDVAWKNGLFNFENASLAEVMRQLERWYDIDVRYEGGIPDIHFGGKMSRHLRLSQVLSALEMSKVRFRMEEGRKLIILQ